MCYISRCCRHGPDRRQCQLVSAHSLVELAAGIIKLQTGFRPGAPPRGETARSSACQQLIRATLTPATRLHPHAIQTTYPHTTNHTTNRPNSMSTHHQPHSKPPQQHPNIKTSSQEKLMTGTPVCPTGLQKPSNSSPECVYTCTSTPVIIGETQSISASLRTMLVSESWRSSDPGFEGTCSLQNSRGNRDTVAFKHLIQVSEPCLTIQVMVADMKRDNCI